jgi:hypothetical protein
MTLEQTLIEELRFVADSADPPVPPSVAELVRIAERIRTRSRLTRVAGTALVAAAVVTAIVIGTQVGRPNAAPPPTHPTGDATGGPLPTGAAPKIPYVLDGTLYIDGRARPGTWSSVMTVGRTSLAVNGPDGAERNPVVLFHDGVEVARLTKDGTQDAVLSPGGTKIAWIEDDAGTGVLVVHDMDTGQDLGRRSVATTRFTGGEENEGWESIQQVDDDGTVTYGSVVVTHTWKPSSDPVDSTPTSGSEMIPGFPERAGYVWLSPEGTWGAWQTDRTGDPAPDEGNGLLDGITVQHPGDRASRFTIALPARTDARRLEWETSTDLLVTVFDDRDGNRWHFLRCDVTERSCEQVPTGAAN